jgi:hypothetical protein
MFLAKDFWMKLTNSTYKQVTLQNVEPVSQQKIMNNNQNSQAHQQLHNQINLPQRMNHLL